MRREDSSERSVLGRVCIAAMVNTAIDARWGIAETTGPEVVLVAIQVLVETSPEWAAIPPQVRLAAVQIQPGATSNSGA